jgi:hypothetical protein
MINPITLVTGCPLNTPIACRTFQSICHPLSVVQRCTLPFHLPSEALLMQTMPLLCRRYGKCGTEPLLQQYANACLSLSDPACTEWSFMCQSHPDLQHSFLCTKPLALPSGPRLHWSQSVFLVPGWQNVFGSMLFSFLIGLFVFPLGRWTVNRWNNGSAVSDDEESSPLLRPTVRLFTTLQKSLSVMTLSLVLCLCILIVSTFHIGNILAIILGLGVGVQVKIYFL